MDSPIKVTRSTSVKNGDIEVQSWASSSSKSSKNKIFPFSTALSSSVPRNDSITSSLKSKFDNGVFLTWKDLSVVVPSGKKENRKHAILQELTGYVEPGQILAIMGPSGCGKSTLLDALAGRLSSNTEQTGEILINGRKETLAFGTSAYVTQEDTLMTTLTVMEAIYYSAQLQLPDSMSRSQKRERAEMTIREMGLQDAMDTRIGGWNVRGISGGQKRRVSICIEILTCPKLLFLDEPTSGLDSAASYHVMKRIVNLAHEDGITVVASIHQPSSDVFELFHNLCLLAYGKTIYFGPASMTEQLFASNGFPCPSLRNPSDHYLRTINKDFEEDIEEGIGRTSTEEVINILVNSYKSSDTYSEVQERVSIICQHKRETLEKENQASFITQSLVLTKRSFVNMYRDLGYYWLRFAIYIALGLCIGTIFHDIGSSYGSIQARGSMLMFIAAFLTFMAIGGFPSFVEDMKIFGRERLNGHYGVASFVLSNSFSSTPYLLLISLIPGAIAYYLTGLQKNIGHFLYFVLGLFVSMMLVESLMMIVASIVPDFLMGIITGAGIQGIMMLNGGFFRLPNDLPKPVWKYPMYYIAFHRYAFQGFYKNEFEGLTFPNNQAGGPPTITGKEVLTNIWQVDMGHTKWVDLAILFGMLFFYRFLFWVIIKTTENLKPIIRSFRFASSEPS
ncbi:ABC transporter G family member 1-like isoform X2 [Citrus sinensis]|uniref:ABC transporter G family member 1-like isoform X2 n=1 Tax=Citrus sinensis TaxID=2711 RepID=UPI002278BB90|nr:ABC transporter G family member 1-like isoform X2 [Citrus sinensis]